MVRSPHLTIYKPQIGSIMSILGRITGLFLYLILLCCLIVKSNLSIFLSIYDYYLLTFLLFKSIFQYNFVTIFIYLFLLSLVYHIVFSIRYLAWYSSGGYNKYYGIDLKILEEKYLLFYLIINIITLILWLII